MAKDVILTADLGGKLLSGEELAAIPDFAGIRKEIWDKFPGAIARKEYRAGEILMREGENGTTAFYILSGNIELFIHNPVAHVESHRASSGSFFALSGAGVGAGAGACACAVVGLLVAAAGATCCAIPARAPAPSMAAPMSRPARNRSNGRHRSVGFIWQSSRDAGRTQ